MSFFRKSKKTQEQEKNIYTIDLPCPDYAMMYSMRKTTPLDVVSLNGHQIHNYSAFKQLTEFPNPCANRMVAEQHLLAEALGTKISTQIIEYLDKATGKPVVQVYPDSFHIFDGYEKNYMSHLSHAMRRDLNEQIDQRNRLMDEFIAKQNQNQK